MRCALNMSLKGSKFTVKGIPGLVLSYDAVSQFCTVQWEGVPDLQSVDMLRVIAEQPDLGFELAAPTDPLWTAAAREHVAPSKKRRFAASVATVKMLYQDSDASEQPDEHEDEQPDEHEVELSVEHSDEHADEHSDENPDELSVATFTTPLTAALDVQDFLSCPITKQVMDDPVFCDDGFIYERAAIERHLRQSRESPVTRAAIRGTLVISFHMRTAIAMWKAGQP